MESTGRVLTRFVYPPDSAELPASGPDVMGFLPEEAEVGEPGRLGRTSGCHACNGQQGAELNSGAAHWTEEEASLVLLQISASADPDSVDHLFVLMIN